MKTIIRTGVLIAAMLAAGARPASAASIMTVSLDTSALAGAGAFALDFQLTDGSGSGDGSARVELSGFGGTFTGVPELFGGAAGDVSKGVVLTDTDFFNAFTMSFTPGDALTFQVRSTTVPPAGFTPPDLFSVSLLRLALADGTPVFEFSPLLDLEFGNPQWLSVSGVAALNLPAPDVTRAGVPEPGLLGLGAVLAAFVVRRRRNAV